MKTFLESTEKTAVYTFGRNNPPTVGHEKLFNKTVEVAKKHNTVAHIFTSHSQDAKKNPLTAEYKVELIKHAYPEAHVASSSKEMPSMLHIAQHLHKQGYQHLIMVAGSDRVNVYQEKLHQYNGTHPGALYNFKSIKVESAGQRDPDAEGAAGMSGTKLRGHAIAGEKEKFKSGLLSKLTDEHKEQVYHAVRKSLKVSEVYDPHLKISKYQWGEKEGTDHMKTITPGQDFKTMKKQKVPFLLMTQDQKDKIKEEIQANEAVWDQAKERQHLPKEKLSSSSKAKAKARAKAAGRPYPNMVDNIWAARQQESTVLTFKHFIMEQEEKDNELSDEDLDKMVELLTWEDIVDLYTEDELTEDERLEEAISAQARLKKRQAFARNRSRRNIAKNLKLHRSSSPDVLKKRAVEAARRALYKRLLRGRDRSTLSASEKNRIEMQVKNMKSIQQTLVNKMLPKIRGIEQSRLANYRAKK